MKKLLVAVLAIGFASIAEAGVYHNKQYLFCYDCHTMHASQSKGYTTGTVSTTGALYGNWLPAMGVPSAALLKGSGSAVCTACHQGQTFAPNVIDGTNGTQGARSAGGFNQTGGGGHALGGSGPPGGTLPTGQTSLECTSCHIQHGGTSYRNLGSRSNADVTPTFAIRTGTSNIYDDATDVFVSLTDASTSYVPALAGSFNGYYQMGSTSYQGHTVGTVGLTNRLNNFCAQCHSTFHGAAGTDANIGGESAAVAFAGETPAVWQAGGIVEFLRHPTAGVYVGQVSAHGHSTPPQNKTAGTAPLGTQDSFYSIPNKVKFGRAGGAPAPFTITSGTTTTIYWDPTASTIGSDVGTVLCISCHNAHGSNKPFGLRFLIGKGAAPTNDAALESGTGKYRNLCGQCHSQGN